MLFCDLTCTLDGSRGVSVQSYKIWDIFLSDIKHLSRAVLLNKGTSTVYTFHPPIFIKLTIVSNTA